MTDTSDQPYAEIPVRIQNWADAFAKPPRIANTTVQTFVIDSAGANGVPKSIQIATEEPNRVRMVVQPIDKDIVITKDRPTVSPDPTAAGVAAVGRLLPSGAPTIFFEYEFFGPDGWWVNSVAGLGRFTVTKEFI